jgi:hypothetical protein
LKSHGPSNQCLSSGFSTLKGVPRAIIGSFYPDQFERQGLLSLVGVDPGMSYVQFAAHQHTCTTEAASWGPGRSLNHQMIGVEDQGEPQEQPWRPGSQIQCYLHMLSSARTEVNPDGGQTDCQPRHNCRIHISTGLINRKNFSSFLSKCSFSGPSACPSYSHSFSPSFFPFLVTIV